MSGAIPLRVLVACEFSGRVRDAFLALGHDAYSVDLEPSESDRGRHIKDDAVDLIKEWEWDLVIAFPPCTYLTTAGARHWTAFRESGQQAAAASFVQQLWHHGPARMVIENPSGWLNTNWRKPTQTVDPWWFGDPYKKRTCLWIRGLPALVADQPVEPSGHWVGGGSNRMATTGPIGGHRNARDRSRTFPGIARAMAEQWGGDAR